MTMMERSQDSKKIAGFILGGVAFLTLVLFSSAYISSFIRGVFVSIQSVHGEASKYDAYSRDALIQTLKIKDEELSRIRYESLLFGLLTKENESLRKAVSARPKGDVKTARVLWRPPTAGYDTLGIDIGSADGVQENDMVIFSGVALGKIVSVSSSSSLVKLFSSPGSSNDVILGTPSAVVVARGLGAGSFEVSIPQGIKVAVGDVVRFPASNSLLLGVVQNVSSEERDILQTVHFSIPVSFSELDFVSIIRE